MVSIIVAIIGALAIVGAGIYTGYSTRKAAEISREASRQLEASRVKVDELQVAREAYETANRITGGLLTSLTKEVTRLNLKVSDLESSNRKLEQTARALIDTLHEHDIPIPQVGG